jgi:hypothetical protein
MSNPLAPRGGNPGRMADFEYIYQLLPGVLAINMMVCAIEYNGIYAQLSLYCIDDLA